MESAGRVVVAGSLARTTSEAVVCAHDEQGAVQWRSGLDTPTNERCVDMTIDAGGNVLVTMAVEIGRLRTVKSDPNGAVVWTREHSMEGGWMSYPMAIGVGSDLSVAVVGIAAGDSTSIA